MATKEECCSIYSVFIYNILREVLGWQFFSRTEQIAFQGSTQHVYIYFHVE